MVKEKQPPRLVIETDERRRRRLHAAAALRGTSAKALIEEWIDSLPLQPAQPDRTLDTPAPYPGKASSGGGQE